MNKHPKLSIFLNIFSVIVATAAATGILIQTWNSSNQSFPLPAISASTEEELINHLGERRKGLAEEITRIDLLLESIEKKSSSASEDSGRDEPLVAGYVVTSDLWWISIFKAIGVYLVLVGAVVLSVLAVLVDGLSKVTTYDSTNFIGSIWNWVWYDFVLAWYWNKTTYIGAIMSIVVFMSFAIAAPAQQKN